jgi:hypothetical protein
MQVTAESPTPSPYPLRLVAGAVHFVGSIKWLESQPFGSREYDTLAQDVLAVPGAAPDASLVAVSRSGVVHGLRSASCGPLGA